MFLGGWVCPCLRISKKAWTAEHQQQRIQSSPVLSVQFLATASLALVSLQKPLQRICIRRDARQRVAQARLIQTRDGPAVDYQPYLSFTIPESAILRYLPYQQRLPLSLSTRRMLNVSAIEYFVGGDALDTLTANGPTKGPIRQLSIGFPCRTSRLGNVCGEWSQHSQYSAESKRHWNPRCRNSEFLHAKDPGSPRCASLPNHDIGNCSAKMGL